MIINGQTLLEMAPIEDMAKTKLHEHGTSYGLGEAGYDIRIKQNVLFRPYAGRCQINVGDEPLKFGRFTLASAIERFVMPLSLTGIVHDKSTWARQGLSVFNTVIEPGWTGYLTLELVYHGDTELFIPAGSGIAQVLFHEVTELAKYAGKYQNQADEPVPAKAHTFCSECGSEQFETPSGITCQNGHGGAAPAEPLDLPSDLKKDVGPVLLWDDNGVYPSNLNAAVQQQCKHSWEYNYNQGTNVCKKCGYIP